MENIHHKFPETLATISSNLSLINSPLTNRYLNRYIQDKEKKQIFTVKGLKPDNVSHLCLKNVLNDKSVIKIHSTDYITFSVAS